MSTLQQTSKSFSVPKTLLFAAVFTCSVSMNTSCGDGQAKNRTSDATITAKENDNKIPGLQPVDIYLNLEKQNFETSKKFSSEYGNSWDCKSSMAGIDYTVNVFSNDVNSVEHVKATAMLNGEENKEIIATKPFLKYVASVPYDGSDPKKVAEWIDKNFNNDKQSLTVSGVTFTIYAPTELLRMITIEKGM